MWKSAFCLLLSLGFTTQVAAEITEFKYLKQGKKTQSERSMRRVYDVIPNPSQSAAKARLTILTAMQAIKGPECLLEEEGEDFIICRWDYKGHTVFHRVEYSADAVQIKYAGGLNAYVCEDLRDGFCYKTHSKYYKYTANLRKIIANTL